MYSYDNIYQITEVNYPAGFAYLARHTGFEYDAAGNRTSVIDVNTSATTTYTTNDLNQYTAAGGVSFSYDPSGNMTQDANYTYTYDPENRLTQVHKPNPPVQYFNSFSAYTQGGDAPWVPDEYEFAQSGAIGNDQESWMSIDVQGPGTVRFQWKVDCAPDGDHLEFQVGGSPQRYLQGRDWDWQGESVPVAGSGTHTLQWRYVKNEEGSEGLDGGYVKDVNFTPDPLPEPDHLAEAVDSGIT